MAHFHIVKPPQPPEPETGTINAVLDKGAEFEGKLTFEGTVRIGGKFKGEIFTNDVLVISEGAEVTAQIDAAVVIVSGVVNGNIFARERVVAHPPAVIRGTVTTPRLRIDEGVVFEGSTSMPRDN
ncbi:MAG: polymer-forming cytoskeletal protein [Oligoflexia bacterium]|nr:polymer-forming cytoskeletal protein [Oligoflexia bacterium]